MQATKNSTQKPGLKPTKSDLEVLRHFARFPWLYADQAVVVSNVAPKSVAGRLRRLVDCGLLCFPCFVRDVPDHLVFPRILAITPSGLREVQRSFPRQRIPPSVVEALAWANRSSHT